MGIRSPAGLQMCKLRLWFAREFATTRTERSVWVVRPPHGDRGADHRSVQKAQCSGGAQKAHEGSATGGAKSCRVSRRSSFKGKRKPASLGGGARRASGVGDNEKRGEEESATPAVTQISVSRDQPFYARSVALVEGNVACLGLDHFLIPSTSEITAVTLVMATSGNPDVNRFLSC